MSDLIDRLERGGPDDEVMVLTGAEAAALREKHPWHAHRIRAVTEPTISSPRGDLYVAEGVTAWALRRIMGGGPLGEIIEIGENDGT